MSETHQTLEELQAYVECWWNTSQGLEQEFPGIETCRGWDGFKVEFDKPENQLNRLKESARQGAFLISPELMKLLELAEIAASSASKESFFQHRTLGPSEAGKLLGASVMELFSVRGIGKLEDCLADLKMRSKKANPKCRDYESNVAEVCHAFLSFISRERKLPKKKELNFEANRIRNELTPLQCSFQPPLWDSADFTKCLKKAGLKKLSKAPAPRSRGG